MRVALEHKKTNLILLSIISLMIFRMLSDSKVNGNYLLLSILTSILAFVILYYLKIENSIRIRINYFLLIIMFTSLFINIYYLIKSIV
jgi:hypothetical protein